MRDECWGWRVEDGWLGVEGLWPEKRTVHPNKGVFSVGGRFKVQNEIQSRGLRVEG